MTDGAIPCEGSAFVQPNARIMELRARALDLGVELGKTSPAPPTWPSSVSYFDRATISGVIFAIGGATLDEHLALLEEVVGLVEGAKHATT